MDDVRDSSQTDIKNLIKSPWVTLCSCNGRGCPVIEQTLDSSFVLSTERIDREQLALLVG